MHTGKPFSNTVSLLIFQPFHSFIKSYAVFTKSVSLFPPSHLDEHFPSRVRILVFCSSSSFLSSPANPFGAASVCTGAGPSLRNLTETRPPKNTDSLSPSSHHLPIVLQPEVGLPEPRPLSHAGLVLCRSYAGAPSNCEVMSAVSRSCPEYRALPWSSSSSGANVLTASSSSMLPGL